MNRRPFRDRIIQFMYNRNGMDQFSSFLLIIGLIVVVVNLFIRIRILSLVYIIILAYVLFRTFSKNLYKRRIENSKYLSIMQKIKSFFVLQKNKFRDRHTHIYRKCPNCKNVLRLQKIKGKHTVNCPCCHNKFDINV